jgi:uncharacterized protein YdaU (DUF1376 family)
VGKDPAMPFYVNDWLSSASVTRMTMEQQAAYLRLLCHCWASQDASLPCDSEALASLSNLGRRWSKLKTLILACFIDHPDKPGYLTQQKTYELWQERMAWRDKSSAAGKKSAEVRKSKGGSTNVQPKRQPKRQAKGNSSSSSSSPSSSSSNSGRPVDHARGIGPEGIETVRHRARQVVATVGRPAVEREDRSLVLKAAAMSLRTPFSEHWLYDAAEGVARSSDPKGTHYGYLHTCLANSAAELGRPFNRELAKTPEPVEADDFDAPTGLTQRSCVKVDE